MSSRPDGWILFYRSEVGMADPRYKNNSFNGNAYRHSRRLAISKTPPDSPSLCGWQIIKIKPSGAILWQLEVCPDVQMRRVEKTDPECLQGMKWVVSINGCVYGYNGLVDEITQDILECLEQPMA